MDVLESLFQWFASLAYGLGEAVEKLVVTPFLGDAAYRQGFCWGLVFAAVVGFLSTALRYFWNDILQFFSPSRVPPAPGLGPSPANRFGGCVVSFFLLLLLLAGVLAFVGALLRGPG